MVAQERYGVNNLASPAPLPVHQNGHYGLWGWDGCLDDPEWWTLT